MPNPLTRKLELFASLSEEDRLFLDRIIKPARSLPARATIINEGDTPDDVHLVLEGLACRCKHLADGAKQIFAFLVPGDFCDTHVFILKAMDHTIETISPCRMVDIPRARVLEMLARPAIARAMWWATLVDEATLREWLVNLGQREAFERIAHLFCEMHLRLDSVGLATTSGFNLPITQADLGCTTGLTPIHVNRSLMRMRQMQLIEFKSGRIEMLNLARLKEVAGFNPNYLHLNGGKERASVP